MGASFRGWGCSLALVAGLLGIVNGQVVTISTGMIRGYYDDDWDVNVFQGIPYAAPPTGQLRWKAPQAPASWNGIRDCREKGNMCPQDKKKHLIGHTTMMGDEDCLNLDVYAPLNGTNGTKLPVMFFIHGGGFRTGDTNGEGTVPLVHNLYYGASLASRENAIVISINYRMGIFGWLALSELSAERPDGSTGNYGLMDQRFAMQWAKANAASFGGDPNRIMIFGESAGAVSVCAHMVSKASGGLFQRAGMESPFCAGKLSFMKKDQALNWGNLMVERANCKRGSPEATAECMRGLPALSLLMYPKIKSDQIPPNPPANPHLPWGLPVYPWVPVIDGTDVGVKDHPLKLIQEGHFNDVPFFMGTNANEGTVFLGPLAGAAGVHLPLSKSDSEKILNWFFPDNGDAAKVMAMYEHDGSTWNSRMAAMVRDYALACPSRAFVRGIDSWRKSHSSPNINKQWMYVFSRHYLSVLRVLGDFHGVELFWVFGHALDIGGFWTKKDYELSAQMGRYWGGVARSGDPNEHFACEGCIQWQPNSALKSGQTGDLYMDFLEKPGLRLVENLYSSKCDFWDKLGYDN